MDNCFLSEHWLHRENECQYVTNVLKENNYPKSFLHDCLRRPTLTDGDSAGDSPEGDSAVKGFAIVPYILFF